MEKWQLCLLSFLLLIGVSKSQTPCETTTGGNTVNVYISECSLQELTANPDNYLNDTQINGIANGTNSATGVTLELTYLINGSSVEIFSLETRTIPFDGVFSTRTFLRLTHPFDRDLTVDKTDDIINIYLQIKCTRVGVSTAKFITLSVNIVDVNDNTPYFLNEPYRASVAENLKGGTTVFTGISALDVDSNDDLDFSLLSEGNVYKGNRAFFIQVPRRGYVTLGTVMDYESLSQKYFNLTIVVSDNRTPPRSAITTLIIDIDDIDDLQPEFVYNNCFDAHGFCSSPEYLTEITSNVIGGNLTLRPPLNPSATVTLAAQDRDTLDAPIQFSIAGSKPDGYAASFRINGIGIVGKLYSAKLEQTTAIGRNVIENFELVINAQELNTLQQYITEALIRVKVVEANNFAPVITVPFSGYIYENAKKGTSPTDSASDQLLRVAVTDSDLAAGESGNYSLSISNSMDFTVDSNGYIILNTNNLDYETEQLYNLTIRAVEIGTAGPRTGSTSVIIYIRDINDITPAFVMTQYYASKEAKNYSISPETVVQIEAQDRDSDENGNVNFSIVSVIRSGNCTGIDLNVTDKFYLTKGTKLNNLQRASLSINGSVSAGDLYIIIVQAEDSAADVNDRRSSQIPVIFTVTGTGEDLPVISQDNYLLSISEATPVSTSIYTVQATDLEGSAFIYSITSGNTGSDFSINQNTGVITVANFLNREAVPSYTIGWRVTDNAGTSDTGTLRITITDVNDINPTFSQAVYYFSVSEGLCVGAFVGTPVVAVDGDAGNNAVIRYEVSRFLSPGSENKFTINSVSGQISTTSVLDYEAFTQHNITILAIDQGTSPRTGTAVVVINVTDVKDETPVTTGANRAASVFQITANNTPLLQLMGILWIYWFVMV